MQQGSDRRERCDVVVVGARCAGAAAACSLAQAGRRVIVLDRATFPSDTLSTHVLFPTGVDELRRMGALARILALDPALLHRVRIELPGLSWHEYFRPVGGIDYGICVPRDLQDAALVATVRAHGVDVRERCEATELTWEAGRVTGVRYRDPDGEQREVAAGLVVGADGRRSTVAARVGSWRPYRLSLNGRGLIFRYMDDPSRDHLDTRTMCQWRDADSFAFAFPIAPRGRLLILFMGDREEVSWARRDPEGYWGAKLEVHPGVAKRCAGATGLTKLRSTGDTPAFFRASTGPGWALAGDAGHFKDPVIGQGMRDAMWMGRTLAESVAPALDDPAALDRAARRWEHERDRECLPAYHWGNAETRVQAVSPVFRAVIAALPVDGPPTVGDVFARNRTPQQVLTLPRLARATASAVRAAGPGVLPGALADLRTELRVRRELRAGRFRATGPISGSEHPGAKWPQPPKPRAGDPPPAPPAAEPSEELATA